MLISPPSLAKYSEQYRRQLFLSASMFGHELPLNALRINVMTFGVTRKSTKGVTVTSTPSKELPKDES